MSAGDTIAMLPDAIRGKDIPARYRDPQKWNQDDIVSGKSSPNIATMNATNALFYQRTHGGLQPALRNAFLKLYSQRNWLHIEPYSSFRYGYWQLKDCLAVAALADGLGISDLHLAAEGWMTYFRLIATLSAGWEPMADRFDGFPTTMTGARSFTCATNDQPNPGSYFDDNGKLKAPYALWDTELDPLLGIPIGAGGRYKDLQMVLDALADVGMPYRAPQGQALACRRFLAAAPKERVQLLPEMLRLLDACPAVRPKTDAVILCTDEAVCFHNLSTINANSTCYCYARIWYEKGRPAIPWLDALPWAGKIERHFAFLTPESQLRESGIVGFGKYEVKANGIELSCERGDGGPTTPPESRRAYFNWKTQTYVKGWRTLTVPGHLQYAIEIGRHGEKLVYPTDQQPPVEPPKPPKTNTALAVKRLMKFQKRAANVASPQDDAKALRLYDRWARAHAGLDAEDDGED